MRLQFFCFFFNIVEDDIIYATIHQVLVLRSLIRFQLEPSAFRIFCGFYIFMFSFLFSLGYWFSVSLTVVWFVFLCLLGAFGFFCCRSSLHLADGTVFLWPSLLGSCVLFLVSK